MVAAAVGIDDPQEVCALGRALLTSSGPSTGLLWNPSMVPLDPQRLSMRTGLRVRRAGRRG
jgi:hypothetical protein